MNAIYFGAKRVFHGFLRITREPFESNELTAARFDLMIALREKYKAWPRVWQSDLWRVLGVTPSVVSRMLRGLEERGLIRRQVSKADRRQREVIPTERGLECLELAYQMVVRWVRRFVYEVICFGAHRDPDERFRRMAQLESYLSALRRYSYDTAKLRYAWGHPDD